MATPRGNQLKFDTLREQALDLLEWQLSDISPDKDHPIHLKMGIEREANFVDNGIADFDVVHKEGWRKNRAKAAKTFIASLPNSLKHAPDIQRLYYDDSATFQVELATTPLPPKEAAKTTTRVSHELIEYALQYGYEKDRVAFGTLNANFLNSMDRNISLGFEDYHDEVFTFEKEGQKQTVISGRGQHANVSLWCGDNNLYSTRLKHSNTPIGLEHLTAHEANDSLPCMALISRHGNYYDIAANAGASIQKFGMSTNNKYQKKALNLRSDNPKTQKTQSLNRFCRIEFRQCAADADPLDVALCAAIPATKAFVNNVKLDANNKAIMNGDLPIITLDKAPLEAHQENAMPHSEEEAKALFNTPNNPNFNYLNEVVQRKVANLEALCKTDKSISNQQALREAKSMLGIGSRLHAMYCQQYGMESVMEQPEAFISRP